MSSKICSITVLSCAPAGSVLNDRSRLQWF